MSDWAQIVISVVIIVAILLLIGAPGVGAGRKLPPPKRPARK